MAFQKWVRSTAAGICLLAGAAVAAQDQPKPNTLTPKEVAEGWVQLFDGATTFGWMIGEGSCTAKDGRLILGGGNEKTHVAHGCYFPAGTIKFRYEAAARPGGVGPQVMAGGPIARELKGLGTHEVTVDEGEGSNLGFVLFPGSKLVLSSVLYRPSGLKPLFNGKDLAGWKVYKGDPKREKSKVEVTKEGELRLTDGPGDLQTDGQWADFVLQLECKTNGPALNSGVFFRCLPGQYQQGYEAQIHNAYLNGDRTKPIDFGTGAIYRRVPARKVAAEDKEWFTMTVLARGPRIATWVNGYPTANWLDDRKPADNARQGVYQKAGPISLQGHDPTTDLLFRNIRLAEVK